MKKKKLVVLFTVIFALCNITALNAMGLLESAEEKQKKDIYNLKQEIVPMKFTLQKSRNSDEFTIKYKFYDLNKNFLPIEETEEKTAKIKGKELFIECVVVNLGWSSKAVFPYRIYSELVPPSEGIVILNNYNYNDYPAIFNGIKNHQMEDLKYIYTDIKNKDFSKKWFYSVVHTVAPRKTEKYKLVCRMKGGIEIFNDEEDEDASE